MLLISPQAVMFEPTDFHQSAAVAASTDDDTSTTTTTTTTTGCDEAAQHDCIIVPMDSISSIMISHDCAAATVSTRSDHALPRRPQSTPCPSKNWTSVFFPISLPGLDQY